MAEPVVSFVVERLGDSLIQEANFLHGVSNQVKQMQTELKRMQSFLKDADKRKDEDETVRVWVSEIREAAYDAEDVIETFALKIATRRSGGIQNAFKRYACIINEAKEIHKVGSEIEAIKTRISDLTRSLQTYGIQSKSKGEGSSSAHGMQLQWRQSYSHVVEEYTVGLDGDIKILVAQLLNEEKNHRVVSICGMGGLGKTTLAKKVYHHSDIRHHFDGFAWAYISQQCQRRDVWEGILFNLISPSKERREEIKGLRDAELAEKLYQVLQEKKCLVILDDIWRPEAWDSLSPSFPVGKAGSKMLLTTRNKEVALHVDDGRGILHEPQNLTEDESWELLQKKAFPRKDDPDFRINTELENLGRKMVRRCKFLPLAIVVLGGLLATKHTLNEWEMVHKNINSNLSRGKGHEHSGVTEVLALSYHELPYQLKPCFLHLGHFPEDFDIPTKKLVRMWVAEGIVSPMLEGEETMEDVAERYLGELLDRCMVQVGVRVSTRRVKTCRLHDLMRDLCLLMANQENFLEIVPIQNGNEPMVSPSYKVNIAKSSGPVRRLAIYSSEETYENFSWECERTPYLRSLLFFSSHNDGTIILEKKKSTFSDFKLLKILDLEQYRIAGKLPREVGNLIHLRYLSLDCRLMTDIPSSIGNLRCLQTLILQTIWYVEIKVPNVIWKMERLRHLYLGFKIKSSGKLRLGNVRNLQTLIGFDIESFDVKELTNMTNLKKLQITSKLEKLAEYPQFPPSLTKLTLFMSELKEDPMATLENLPNLSTLRLRINSFIGKEMVCSTKGFPQLKSLVLSWLPNLVEWRVGEEAMPSLYELAIENCKELKMVPDGLRFITTLRKLEIVEMPEAFRNRLQEGGEDSYKVKHVPSITFKGPYF